MRPKDTRKKNVTQIRNTSLQWTSPPSGSLEHGMCPPKPDSMVEKNIFRVHQAIPP